MPQSKHKQHREAHQPQWAAKAKQHQLTGDFHSFPLVEQVQVQVAIDKSILGHRKK